MERDGTVMARKASEKQKKKGVDVRIEERESEEKQDPSDTLEQAQREAAENYDRFVRLSAELDNYKKRTARDRADLVKYANERLIRDILPIKDSMERALDQVSSSDDLAAFVKGLGLIHEQLTLTLGKNGVEKIETAGRDFDPTVHEAMLQVDTDECDADNKIADVYETGYLLNGRLLRPAKVSIMKYSKENSEE